MSKAKVIFSVEDLEVEAPTNTPLTTIVDKTGADITFGCRAGTCGTCRVKIKEGMENLVPPSSDETRFLKALGDNSNTRLACQVVVEGDCSIEYIGRDGWGYTHIYPLLFE